MNGITSEMLKAEGDCVYAFPGIKQAFNGDHRRSAGGLEERISSSAGVTCETGPARHVLGVDAGRRHEAERTRPVPSQSSVRPVRDAIGCRLALAFRPGSYRVPGGVKGRSWQVPGWYACGWYVKVYAKCLLNLMRCSRQGPLGAASNKLGFAQRDPVLSRSSPCATNNKGQMDNELDCRHGEASAAFNQLGFETYYVEISQEREKRLESLDASDSECVRKILSIRRQDFIPNTDI
ncbi:hypothetical protein Bbelb_419620 [Branchiostoma belcheri]|nr:hypothetical protein Bbelb_419620 [Branchiostoma belcheri]